MKTLTDFQLTQWYRRGWHDEATGQTSSPPVEAWDIYSAGANGCVDRNYVYKACPLTDEEILKLIRT